MSLVIQNGKKIQNCILAYIQNLEISFYNIKQFSLFYSYAKIITINFKALVWKSVNKFSHSLLHFNISKGYMLYHYRWWDYSNEIQSNGSLEIYFLMNIIFFVFKFLIYNSYVYMCIQHEYHFTMMVLNLKKFTTYMYCIKWLYTYCYDCTNYWRY